MGLVLQPLLGLTLEALVSIRMPSGKKCSQDEDEVVGLSAEGDVGVTRRQVGVMLREQVQNEGVHQARQPRQHRRHERHDGDALQSSAPSSPEAIKYEELQNSVRSNQCALPVLGPGLLQRHRCSLIHIAQCHASA